MKKRLIVLAVILTLILSGCFFYRKTKYEFRQDFDQIKTIDILKKERDTSDPYTPTQVIKTVLPTEHHALIDALLGMDGNFLFYEPSTGFGLYIIRITYHNGEQELIGAYNNGYISPDGKLHQDVYSFNREQFYDLISQIIGEDISG